jgi:protein involved in polysaccharide export with SLBB domain
MRSSAPLLLALGLALHGAPLRGQNAGATTEAATLQPGDSIRLTVWGEPTLSGGFIVTPDSSIGHPLYREVKVAGIPIPQVRQRIHQFLARDKKEVDFVVEPIFRVLVGGEVRQPSVYAVPMATTVAEVVSLAGGPTERGRLNKVRLLRGGRAVHLDLNDPSLSDATRPVHSGDRITVGRSGNFFRDVIGPLSSLSALAVSFAVLLRQ